MVLDPSQRLQVIRGIAHGADGSSLGADRGHETRTLAFDRNGRLFVSVWLGGGLKPKGSKPADSPYAPRYTLSAFSSFSSLFALATARCFGYPSALTRRSDSPDAREPSLL